MRSYPSQFANICRMIKIEHSIFALPWAWAGAALAAGAFPPPAALLWLTIAMVAVRSYAMAFNRLADRHFDAANPRTRQRPLPSGAISVRQTIIFCVAMALLFIGACACLNAVCLILSVPCLIFAAVYSYLKRVGLICHFWLGATLGLAPVAGWLAVQPLALPLPPILLFLAVTFWVAAFDIYYSFQDMDFDRQSGLHSAPADLGPATARAIAGFSHVMTVIFLILTGISARLGWPWFVVCAGIGALLALEHRLMLPEDLRHVNTAFFTLNGIIAPVVLIGIILGIYF